MSATAPLPPRTWKELVRNRSILSWSFYDWANSAFATTVMAGFFPVFFKQYWSAGNDVNVSTAQLGFANAISSGILALMTPILGALADQGSHRKRFLIVFATLGIVMTGSLSLVAKGDWQTAVLLYLIASIGFAGSNSFYDSFLVFIARPKEMDQVSALGFSLGYLGGGLLFAINVLMTLKPTLFGFENSAEAVQFAFLTVAVWWAVFTLPFVFFVHEKKTSTSPNLLQLAVNGLRQVSYTFREIRQFKNMGLFLFAYFFYIDGVNAIMRMSVDYGLALGFPSESLIVALLMVQFVAFPAALAYGWLSTRIGAKTCLLIAIAAYMSVSIYAYFMVNVIQFYGLAIVIGLFQGGIQSLSRSVFAQMTPENKAGEFFGFYNMLGKFSSMIGPAMIGWISVTTSDSRLAVLSLVLLFIIGGGALLFVKIRPANG
jgi:MFS transporter, UMF1 family